MNRLFTQIRNKDRFHQKIRLIERNIAIFQAVLFLVGIYLIVQSNLFIRLFHDDAYIVHNNIWGVSKFWYIFGMMIIFWLGILLWLKATNLTFIALHHLHVSETRKTVTIILILFLFTAGIFVLSLFSWWHEYMILHGSDWAILWSSGIYEASLIFDIITIFVYLLISFKIVRISFNLLLNLSVLFLVRIGQIKFNLNLAEINSDKNKVDRLTK